MGPYAEFAERYWAAGWRGVLPLPVARKDPPPYGYTGANGQWPSFADVFAWLEEQGAGNICLRLPSNVLGIDVDGYSGKMGRFTLEKAVERWGKLPDTFVSTSRNYGVSGIYLFRVPDDLRWPGEIGPGVELIQYRHRYMVAPPSVHPEGPEYLWFHGQDRCHRELLPRVDDLPWLPDAWVQGITAGQLAQDISKVWVTSEQVAAWIGAAPAGPLCAQVREAVIGACARLREARHSRHETATRGVMRLAHLASEGHHGAAGALGIVHGVFVAVATTGHGARAPEAAGAEWERIVYGAVGVVMPDGFDTLDPCTNPLGVAAENPPGATVGASDNDNNVTLPSVPMDANNLQGVRLPTDDTFQDEGTHGLMVSGTSARHEDNDEASEGYQAGQTQNTQGDDGSPISHDLMVSDPELAMMLEQQLLRMRAQHMAREILERERAQATFRVPPSLPTLADELALPDEDVLWTISDVLPHGANVLLTAQYKTGKTSLVNHTAKSLADGSDFLSRFLVHSPSVNVALWNYEVSAGMYRRWMRDTLVKNTDRISVANLRGYSIPLLVPTVQAWAVDWLASRQVAVWIVDPAARAMPGADENSNMDVSQWLDVLDEIKRQAEVSVLILVTHTGRAEQEQGRERARGATRFDDWADVRWLLTQDDQGFRYFKASGRDVDTDEFRLRFDPLTRSYNASDEERPPKRIGNPSRLDDGQLADIIVRLVRDVPGQTTRTIEANVRAQVKVRNTRIYEQVKALESQRIIVGINGKSGARHMYPPDVAATLAPEHFPK